MKCWEFRTEPPRPKWMSWMGENSRRCFEPTCIQVHRSALRWPMASRHIDDPTLYNAPYKINNLVSDFAASRESNEQLPPLKIFCAVYPKRSTRTSPRKTDASRRRKKSVHGDMVRTRATRWRCTHKHYPSAQHASRAQRQTALYWFCRASLTTYPDKQKDKPNED